MRETAGYIEDGRRKVYRGDGRDAARRKKCLRRRRRRKIIVRLTAAALLLFLGMRAVRGGLRQPEEKDILDGLYSPYAVLMDAESGEMIAERNGRERLYPASLTKMMTAILTIESISDLDRRLILPADAVTLAYAQDASVAGFCPDEDVSYRDLLYGMLLPSGAECCIACAREIAGSEDAFAQMMNQKAAEIGMKDTHFCNAAGLHEKGHYSTASDLACLLRYALQNGTFREIFTSSNYVVGPTAHHPEGFTMQSTMFISLYEAGIDGSVILGGKTGYTEQAGLCLASLAEIDGREYILVTAGAPGSHDTEPLHIYDACTVYGRLAR